MTDERVAGQAVALALSRWGRLDALVVNHGSLEPVGKVGEGSVEGWRRGFEVNVFSAVGLVSSNDFLPSPLPASSITNASL